MTEWIVPAEKELDEEEVAYLKEHGARELVRCKNCKWQDKKHGCEQNNIWAPDDFYCAYGVKKDE